MRHYRVIGQLDIKPNDKGGVAGLTVGIQYQLYAIIVRNKTADVPIEDTVGAMAPKR
jgi:hypothetical protein